MSLPCCDLFFLSVGRLLTSPPQAVPSLPTGSIRNGEDSKERWSLAAIARYDVCCYRVWQYGCGSVSTPMNLHLGCTLCVHCSLSTRASNLKHKLENLSQDGFGWKGSNRYPYPFQPRPRPLKNEATGSRHSFHPRGVSSNSTGALDRRATI